MKFLLTALAMISLIGCATNKLTQEGIAEACNHSKIHHDMAMLSITDKKFEPSSIHAHCNCPYGFPYNDAEMRCKTKEEIEADKRNAKGSIE